MRAVPRVPVPTTSYAQKIALHIAGERSARVHRAERFATRVLRFDHCGHKGESLLGRARVAVGFADSPGTTSSVRASS